MTVLELKKIIDDAVESGFGHADIMFDSEARTFDYHMVHVNRAVLETEGFVGNPFLYLGD